MLITITHFILMCLKVGAALIFLSIAFHLQGRDKKWRALGMVMFIAYAAAMCIINA